MTKSENAFVWDDDATADAKRRWDSGESAGEIAKVVGKIGARPSRSAVLGKVHRMGARRSPAAVAVTMALGSTNKPKPKPAPVAKAHVDGEAVSSTIKPPFHVRYRCEPLPTSKPVSLMDARLIHCRWMITLDGLDLFCGADKSLRRDGELSPYCQTHTDYARRRMDSHGERYVKAQMRHAK